MAEFTDPIPGMSWKYPTLPVKRKYLI